MSRVFGFLSVVIVMAAGFFSYAAWRLLEAWLDTAPRPAA